MSIAAPPSPSETPDFPPHDLQPKRGVFARLFAWVARTPKAAFWLILIAGTVLGAMIGASGGIDQSTLDKANVRAARAESRARGLRSRLSTVNDRLASAKGTIAQLDDKVKTLSAQGEVPSLTGMDVDDASNDDAISAYNWRVRTVRQISSRTPGTVIAQTPREGTTLKAGRSITVTVAKKAPPKPKQWVTVRSFSGAGSKHTDDFTIPAGVKTRIKYSFVGDTNAILDLKSPDDELSGDLLLNEIGNYSDTTRVYESGRYYLDIEGGSWQVQVQEFKRPR